MKTAAHNLIQAPFCKGEKSFIWENFADFPGINDEMPACKIFGVPEILQNIMKHLSYPDISALQRCCTMVGNQVMRVPVRHSVEDHEMQY